jgi:hypothetical protein
MESPRARYLVFWGIEPSAAVAAVHVPEARLATSSKIASLDFIDLLVDA